LAASTEPCGGQPMGTRKTRDLPARLEGLRRRFERWRRTREGRSRIPEPLWTSAVKVAGRYGTGRTARLLRVDYYSLKKRVEGAPAATASRVPAGAAGAAFLELAPPVQVGPCEWTLEFEAAGGARMRLHFKGVQPPDLAALSRGFWQVES
jgi:hypothetical protein